MTDLRGTLWYLLGGTRGGPLRIRILEVLRERPLNTNQLAERLDVDYKTAQHHLEVLEENGVVEPSGDEYGAVFLPTATMGESWDLFEEIVGTVADDEAGGDA